MGRAAGGTADVRRHPPGAGAPGAATRGEAAPGPELPAAAHGEEAEAVVAALGSDARRGLDGAEARRRLGRHGPNRLRSAPETPWWRRLLEQFQNVLVVILLVATAISAVEWLLQDPRETALPYEAIVILAIVVLNALLGFAQEARAEKAVQALMALAAPEATVVRGGERLPTATDGIVPGDILLVEAGDKVPADARLVEEANLQTDEAALTGESLPVFGGERLSRSAAGPHVTTALPVAAVLAVFAAASGDGETTTWSG
jgi:P-type Ca2+ transporter type 2C